MGESVLLYDTPVAPVADRTLHEHRWAMVREDIEDTRDGGDNATQIAAELGNLVGLHRTSEASRQAAAEQVRADKAAKERRLPSQHFGGAITNILRLCGVEAENELPPVWHELAQIPAK